MALSGVDASGLPIIDLLPQILEWQDFEISKRDYQLLLSMIKVMHIEVRKIRTQKMIDARNKK